MRNYAEANAFLGGRKYRTIPSIRSTSMERIDETTIALRYHGTNVVTYRSNGTFVLRSGGWRTVTTKARINEYSPARLSQQNFNWYLLIDGDKGKVDFTDGVVIDSRGRPFTHDESAQS